MSTYPKAIFFDADGTLYDSYPLHFMAYKITSKKLYNFNFTSSLFKSEVVKKGKKAPEVLRSQGVDVDKRAFYAEKNALYAELAATELKVIPGLRKFLVWCHKKNIKCAVVSMARRPTIDTSLRALSLDNFFESIICYEDIENRSKPHPYPYLKGLQLLGVRADQALAIEDTGVGIASAKAADLYCIAIKHINNSKKELNGADHSVNNYAEIRDLIGVS